MYRFPAENPTEVPFASLPIPVELYQPFGPKKGMPVLPGNEVGLQGL